MRELALDRGRQAGDDHEAGPPSFEPFDQRVVVKPFVCADNHQPDSGRDLREAGREQVERPAGGVGVAGPQLAMPEVLALALEAEQRVIRRTAPLDRVVADPGVLLLAVDDQHGGVDIEDQPRRRSRPSVMRQRKRSCSARSFGEGGRSHAQQEPPERRGLGITRQPGEVLKDAVLSQQLRGLDPFEPEDHRVEQRQQHLADAVAVVALDQACLIGQALLEAQTTEETVQQIDSTVMSQ